MSMHTKETFAEKPIHPHYSPTRRSLELAIKTMELDMEAAKTNVGYHDQEAMRERTKYDRLGEHIAHLRKAMGALNALDKAGLIMKDAGDVS